MTYPHVEDPLESAENPQVAPPEYFGQVLVDAYFCVLQKGVGKVPFDAGQHKIEDRRTAIKIGILPLPEQNLTRGIDREYIAEFGAWPKLTLPSLKALGIGVRELNERFVRVAMVPEGRTYVDRNGETRDSLTFKFLAIYANEDACRAAYHGQAVATSPAAAAPQTSAPAQAAPATNGKERETALKFVEALVRQVAGNESELGQRIAAMQPIAKYFSVQSPEVKALLDAYAFDQMAKAA